MRLRAHEREFIGGEMRAAFQPKDPAEPDPAERIEFVPADYFARAKMEDIFPRPAPLQVDVGCVEERDRHEVSLKYLGMASRSSPRGPRRPRKLADRSSTSPSA